MGSSAACPSDAVARRPADSAASRETDGPTCRDADRAGPSWQRSRSRPSQSRKDLGDRRRARPSLPLGSSASPIPPSERPQHDFLQLRYTPSDPQLSLSRRRPRPTLLYAAAASAPGRSQRRRRLLSSRLRLCRRVVLDEIKKDVLDDGGGVRGGLRVERFERCYGAEQRLGGRPTGDGRLGGVVPGGRGGWAEALMVSCCSREEKVRR